jgi:hypothetical protein
MTDAVPAPVALAVLATLSVDLRAAVVLDAGGSAIAGDTALIGPATALLDGSRTGVARRVPHAGGTLFAARTDSHALALAVGPHALEAVVVHDLLSTLDDLRGC